MKFSNKQVNKKQNLLQKFVKRQTYLFVFIVLFIGVGTAILTNIIRSNFHDTVAGYYGATVVCEFIITLLVVLPVLIKLNLFDPIGGYTKKGLGKGLILGISSIGIILFQCLPYIAVYKSQYQFTGYLNFVVAIGFGVMVGIKEEFVIRGILIPILVDKWGENKRNVIKAVWVTSILFGLLHATDFIKLLIAYGHVEIEKIVWIIGHVIYATMAGVFFGAVFVYSKNIWTSVFWHSVIDILSLCGYIVLPISLANQLSSAKGIIKLFGENVFLNSFYADSILACIFAIPSFIAALIMLKRFNEEEYRKF